VPVVTEVPPQPPYGERLDWPTLARSSDGALPVVLLDGFDELLQATGCAKDND
jgi:hypothetical protein